MTVLTFERFSVLPEAEARVRELAGPVVDDLRAAPGALWADLASADDGFLLVSEWRTAADAEAWEAGDVARSFVRALDPLVVGERTLRRFDSR